MGQGAKQVGLARRVAVHHVDARHVFRHVTGHPATFMHYGGKAEAVAKEKGQAFDRLYIDMTPVAAESGLSGRRCLILGQRGEGHRHGIFGIGANAVSAEGACFKIAHRKNRST